MAAGQPAGVGHRQPPLGAANRSKAEFRLHELRVECGALLDLSDTKELEDLGIDPTRFGSRSMGSARPKYARRQEIGEVAHFLDFDGILVPSARYDSANVVVFCGRVAPDNVTRAKDHRPIAWSAWSVRTPRA